MEVPLPHLVQFFLVSPSQGQRGGTWQQIAGTDSGKEPLPLKAPVQRAVGRDRSAGGKGTVALWLGLGIRAPEFYSQNFVTAPEFGTCLGSSVALGWLPCLLGDSGASVMLARACHNILQGCSVRSGCLEALGSGGPQDLLFTPQTSSSTAQGWPRGLSHRAGFLPGHGTLAPLVGE